MMSFRTSIITIIIAAFPGAFCAAQSNALELKYDKPAKVWEETIPLGNGRLGMMPDGGITTEKIVLNDITLWSGAPQDANNYEAYKQLPRIRQLLKEGRNDEAQALMDKDFICTGKGSGSVPFGCYQVLGELQVAFEGIGNGTPEQYERTLSLPQALSTTSFKVNGVTYRREYFTSFGDDLGMIRLSADQPGKLSCRVTMSRQERSATHAGNNAVELSGQLESGNDAQGMQYQATVKASTKGGTISTEGDALLIRNATEIILYVSAGTDFRNAGFKQKIGQTLAAAMKKIYAVQRKQHIANYGKLFNRVELSLGKGSASTLPIDKRLAAYYDNSAADKEMPVLFYQFGRYLLIASTRPGLLPPNLQGLWANQIHTPWNGDYHLDVNVQMNHWPVEVSNLSELNLPLADLVKGMVEPGKRTAKAYYNAPGWVAHVITNIWGFTEPGESASWGATKSGSGWLCNNLWEHYAYTNDKHYLADIYPVIKESAVFYNSLLIREEKTGWLVMSPSSSPENTFYLPNGKHASICIGATIDNQIVRDLFNNVISASRTLGKDSALRNELQEKLALLPPPGVISKDGRILEWLEDYKETDRQHRHISHLWGLYPASLITAENTPDLATAAKKTLEVRGDDGPSWTIAYKLLFWARLQDGNRSFKLLRELLKPTARTDINYGAGGGVYQNMLSAGPPFQIDGNFGATAGIAEMLLQSHAGFINLLPSIPDQWKAEGSVKGLKARGNYTVDFAWKDGKVTSYKITSPTPRKVKVKVNGEMKEITAARS